MRTPCWGLLLCYLLLVVAADGDCEFPREWTGRWFQSGVPHLITINSSAIETKGECVESSGDKFLTEDKVENCYRCVVIHEKHTNVLQYKETFCDNRASLDILCDQITGDATLYSMFRSEPAGRPTTCPFHAPPYMFTYSRGSGECGSPVSRMDSCSDESRLLLRYQACPDVVGTESTVEELVCLATWKEGNTRYLVGKLYHKTATTDEHRYRCFVYERGTTPDGRTTYQVAQSGDATCNGLLSPTEGSRTMKLTKVDNQHSNCHFPSWVTDHHHWHSLDYRQSFRFSHKNGTLRIQGDTAEKRIVCHHNMNLTSSHQAMITAHTTSGCNSGYVCMMFYRRDGHVIELQQSDNIVQISEEACSRANFHPHSLPYTTLITVSLHPQKCPYLGRYTISGVNMFNDIQARKRRRRRGISRNKRDEETELQDCTSKDYETLVVGCSSEKSDTMEFSSSCAASVSAYSCHGSWVDNGTSYLIASPMSRHSGGAHRYCFMYTEAFLSGDSSPNADAKKKRSTMLQVSSVTESCHRNIIPGITGQLVFNLTMNGECTPASSDAQSATAVILPSLLFVITVIIGISNLR